MRRNHRLRLGVATVATLTLCISAVPGVTAGPALAARDGGRDESRAFPSQDQVDRAKADAARKAQEVGEIKGRLLLANQRLEQAALRAEQASEAYNGAMWALEQAKQRARQARADAARAKRTVAGQRDSIGALVAQTYQAGGDLTALNAMMTADGPQGVLDQYSAFQGASTSLQADYGRFAAADALAQLFERQAAQAQAEQTRLAGKAKQARERAVSAAESAQVEAGEIAEQKNRLIVALAKAQNISVSLAQERQTALEEIARKRAEERARRAAIAAARTEARAQAQAAAKAQAARAAAEKAQNRKENRKKDRRHNGGGSTPAPSPTPPPPPPPPPPPAPNPPAPSGGAEQAIRYAKAQVGEPYQWGAAGPDSWDCSGLTMKAWGSAGRYLPHYTVAQYDAGTPISVAQIRPGDLVFWSSNGSPSGIHHVAMYIGGGQIVHAPRTGRPVTVESMYYWVPPDFFVRV